MNVLMVVAPTGFRDQELWEPKEALEAAGHTVTLASTVAGICVGVKGLQVLAKLQLSAVRSEDFGAVVFVGGPGARVFFDHHDAHRLAREMIDARKLVGAIGTAPVILARADVLVHRRVAVFPTERIEIAESGAFPRSDAVITDHNLVTAYGLAAAKDFGAELVKSLESRAAA